MDNSADNPQLHPSGQQLELVAYLDGELDADKSHEVEQRLADDEACRAELQRLDDAWALLDHLPQAEVDDAFTRTTVEMVALAAGKDASHAERSRRWRFWLGWSGAAVVVLAAALTGYFLARRRLDRPNRQLVRDLPVIENVDAYRYAESVQWLEMLDKSEIFSDEEELDDEI